MHVSTICSVLLSFLLWISFRITILTATGDVESVSVVTDTNQYADSDTTLYITLWYNNKVYQYSISNPVRNTMYTANKESSPKYTFLGCTSQSTPDAKIMIQNSDTDSTYIDRISFTTTSGQWYGIEEFCIDTGLYGSYEDQYTLNDNVCSSDDTHYRLLCIDNEYNDCQPYKQVVHFDLTKPNQYIINALFEDGTNIDPTSALTPCTPNNTPSQYPINTPKVTDYSTTASNHPTNSPIEYQTKEIMNIVTEQPVSSVYIAISSTEENVMLSETISHADLTHKTEDRIWLYVAVFSTLSLLTCFTVLIVRSVAYIYNNGPRIHNERQMSKDIESASSVRHANSVESMYDNNKRIIDETAGEPDNEEIQSLPKTGSLLDEIEGIHKTEEDYNEFKVK